MSLTLNRVQSERGAILIHVGLSLTAFMALTAFVLDLGTLLVARRQAQNAADAGALAGATVVLFDDHSMDPTGPASGSATSVAQKTLILNDIGAVDVTMAPSAPATCTSAIVNSCVQVAVQRNDLPTYFSRIFGVTSMSVQAVSTAKVMIANVTACLKPWMLPDNAMPSGYTNALLGTEIILDPSATTPTSPG
jgi:Flp pilus assembly protein TadG